MSVLPYSTTFDANPSPFEMFANLDIGHQDTVLFCCLITVMRPFLYKALQKTDMINEA